MATSKRKESAALFELIDKSTLKVPKNSSALKIPNWWSSKTNPATTAVAPGAPPPPARTRSQAMVAASMAPLVKSPVGVHSPAPMDPMAQSPAVAGMPPAELAAVVESEPQVEVAPAQARLFDPPPPHVAPASSPSIRPPSANGQPAMSVAPPIPLPEISREVSVAPALVEAPPAETPVISAEAPATADPIPAPVAPPTPTAALPRPVIAAVPPALPSSRPAMRPSAPAAPTPRPPAPARVFAPQTYGQDRKSWSSPRPGAFARLPAWALLSAAAGIVIVICIVVLIAKTVGKPPAVAPTRTSLPTPTRPSVEFGAGNVQPPALAAPAARIYAGGAFPYKPELYYVIICTTNIQSTANDYAAHLQKNGVDVAIETTLGQGNKLQFTLVATRGFTSASLAKPYRDAIVRIGDTLSRGVWKDANPTKGLKGVSTAGG